MNFRDFAVILIIFIFPYTAFSIDNQKKLAQELVTKAAEFIKTNGREKGIQELNRSENDFSKGDVFVFAFDTNGIMIANPKKNTMVGVSFIDIPDAEGKLFRQDIIKVAKTDRCGWIDYSYKNPANGELRTKTIYINYTKQIILCCSIFK